MLTPTKLTSVITPPGIVLPGASRDSPSSPISTFSGRIPTQPSSPSAWVRSRGTETVIPCMSTLVMSPSRDWIRPAIRLDWPRKFATNVVRGFS